jgi:ATP-dependent helicase YprA (DUF1998 family)
LLNGNRQSSTVSDKLTQISDVNGVEICTDLIHYTPEVPVYSIYTPLLVKMAEPDDFSLALEYAKNCLRVSFNLKEKQVETLKYVYEGKDTMAVLPTGYGKSVIFQLLPFLFQWKFGQQQPMICIIVTPLNSIMQDQVMTLRKRGIPACYFNIQGSSVKTFELNAGYSTVP